MARLSSPGSPFYPKIRFAFTDHPITVWAGAILLRLYFELIGLRTVLQTILTVLAKWSNNQIPVTDVLLAWFYGLGIDAIPCSLSSWPRSLPSPDTLRRFFLSVTYAQLTSVSETLMRESLARMPRIALGPTLDLDSTVFCR